MNGSDKRFFITGGTLFGGAPSYVERDADSALYNGLSAGEYCHVLSTRQVGKSSLILHVAGRLRADGATVVILDLSGLGRTGTPDQWYFALADKIAARLRCDDELAAFWHAHPDLPPLVRWIAALRCVLLPQVPGALVVCLDEVDAALKLEFSDEFFAGLRACYNRRAEDAEFRRLTFCLVGINTSALLTRDAQQTPFNIGCTISLDDFTADEAVRTLAQGFGPDRDGATLVQRIHYWTNGHPYLTQLLCDAVAANPAARDAVAVDRICRERFFTDYARENERNLAFAGRALLEGHPDCTGLLTLYMRILKSRNGLRMDTESQFAAPLLASGVVVQRGGQRLVVRNRIYTEVFNLAWARDHVPNVELRKAYLRGILLSGSIAAVLLSMMGWALIAVNRAKQAEQVQRHRAESLRDEAEQLRYVANIGLASQAYNNGDLDRTGPALNDCDGTRLVVGTNNGTVYVYDAGVNSADSAGHHADNSEGWR